MQIQITLFASDEYNGLRLNLADIMLPLMGLFIAGSLLLRKTRWPIFQVQYTYFWLAGLTLILLGALIHSYLLYGAISQWALLNKFCGWFVLCAYFLMGAWFVRNLPMETIAHFFKIAVLFFLAVFCVCSIPLFLHYIHIIKNPGIFEFPVAGMMANKNAFIFLFLSFFCLSNLMPRDRFWNKAVLIFWILAPLAYALTFARAGLLIFPVLVLFLWLLKADIPWKKSLLALAFSSSFLLTFNWMGNNNILNISPVDGLTPSRNGVLQDVKKIITLPVSTEEKTAPKNIRYGGDRMRINIILTSLDAIKDHPFIGAGLGSASIYQQQQWGKFINIIDCTPLWLWAETGCIGLIAFLGFYFTCLVTLWKNSAKASLDPYTRSVLKAVLMIMIAFGGMCLLHEILYTRFLWLFMGMALGLQVRQARHQD